MSDTTFMYKNEKYLVFVNMETNISELFRIDSSYGKTFRVMRRSHQKGSKRERAQFLFEEWTNDRNKTREYNIYWGSFDPPVNCVLTMKFEDKRTYKNIKQGAKQEGTYYKCDQNDLILVLAYPTESIALLHKAKYMRNIMLYNLKFKVI